VGGDGWVKARFITPAPPGTPIVEEYPVRMPDGTEKKLKRARVFIPSSVFDNPALLENDPDYLAALASLPEAEKQALLYGSWDSFQGQVFTEWRNDPAHYDDQRWTHVIAPFAIPKHWKIYRGYDFGFSKPFSVGWYGGGRRGAALPRQGTVRLHRTPQRGPAHRPGGAGKTHPRSPAVYHFFPKSSEIPPLHWKRGRFLFIRPAVSLSAGQSFSASSSCVIPFFCR